MEPERWRKIDQVLEEALEHPTAERDRFLDEACEDRELRRDVERFLAAERRAGSFVEHPVGRIADLLPGADSADEGQLIGPYRLLRVLRHGGMGTVYLAVRDDDQYQRQVAIKLVRRGLENRDLLLRFRLERQILAQLEHPNIARLYDGGATAEGRPFLVMEYVEGSQVDAYCDRHELDLEQRLALFSRLCAAVQHAHQNLLVHRDIKPSNVLVTADGEPKLIDFGIAKDLTQETPWNVETRTGERPMTPIYASPEQIRGRAVNTASDVYSLGVLLYELVTGSRPYADRASRFEVERAICEEEPEPPSQALARAGEEVAGARGGRPAELARQGRGDLDAIILKALRKEPDQRYGSAAALAEDLERYLRRLPVRARRDTWSYRTALFLRRHRLGVAAAALVLGLVVAFSLALSQQARHTARERDKAEKTLSLLIDVFASADPDQAAGETLTAREILAAGVERVERETVEEPEIRAALLDALARVFRSLGLHERAAPLAEEAVELQRRLEGEDGVQYAAALHHLGFLRHAQGEYDAARALYEEALSVRRLELGVESLPVAETESALADLLTAVGEHERAEILQRQALESLERHLGPDHPDLGRPLSFLANLLRQRGESQEAEAIYRRVLSLRERRLGPTHPLVAQSLSNVAMMWNEEGRYDESIPLLRRALAIYRESLDPEHPRLSYTLNNLAYALQMSGDLAAAEKLYREVVDIRRQRLPGHPSLANSLNNLATVLRDQAKLAAAAEANREAGAIFLEVYGDRHPKVAQSLSIEGSVAHARDERRQAERLYRRALEILRQTLGEDHVAIAHVSLRLGQLAMEEGHHEPAAALFRRCLEIWRRALPADHWRIALTEARLGACLGALGSEEEAARLLRRSLQVLENALGQDDPRTAEARAHLEAISR